MDANPNDTIPTIPLHPSGPREGVLRRRVSFFLLLMLGWLGLAHAARAGGEPPLDLVDRELRCELDARDGIARMGAQEAPGAYTFGEADEILLDVETDLCMARFAEALVRVRSGRQRMGGMPETWQANRRRARLEIQAATAKIALGQAAAAELNFRWALEIDPYLQLDPQQTSPKVRRLFRASRKSWLAAR